MIDIENQLYTALSTKIKSEYPKIFVTGEYVAAPPTFPAVSIVEIENEVYRKSQSTEEMENHDIVVYEINVYSNKVSGKKSECKAIMKILDREMCDKGFTRYLLHPVPNINDASIYRMVGRWRAIVSKEEVIYRR